MIHSGLVSITFRQLSPQEIVDLVVRAGLEGVEWGGDIHVPHGDLRRAREVRQMTQEAGLAVAAYGSYYRVEHDDPAPFEPALAAAVELGAPAVRVWAGTRGSAEADAAYRAEVVALSRRIADMAAGAGVTVAYEFHAGTLTDTNGSARNLLEAVAHDNVRSYWQPPRGSEVGYNLDGLDAVLPWLLHAHVFSWGAAGERLPLVAGEAGWVAYLHKIASSGRDHFAMLEFVQDDTPENFLRDAVTLKQWLALVN
ncbi:MAG: sugar phosphate isomerase/epimerase [Anaerolineae bacterium]|nr:sugar phosphate isomerase/epimerase [Anaerolineae bacterium]